jgi:hypothetical protein
MGMQSTITQLTISALWRKDMELALHIPWQQQGIQVSYIGAAVIEFVRC